MPGFFIFRLCRRLTKQCPVRKLRLRKISRKNSTKCSLRWVLPQYRVCIFCSILDRCRLRGIEIIYGNASFVVNFTDVLSSLSSLGSATTNNQDSIATVDNSLPPAGAASQTQLLKYESLYVISNRVRIRRFVPTYIFVLAVQKEATFIKYCKCPNYLYSAQRNSGVL